MTIQRERLNRKNASGEYDTIHLETQADLVLMASDPSKNVEQVLGETVSITKGGTGATTAAAGLYNLMAGLTEMTAEELAEDDLLCVLDVDTNSAKKVALSVVGIGGGGTTNPELPDKGSLTLGNTVTFADKQWIVSHVTNTEAYLTLSDLLGRYTWNYLQNACTTFANSSLTEAQRGCLKSITAGNTSGKVFVATYDQMDGGFSYFNSDSKRRTGSVYWTSTEADSVDAWYVRSDGRLSSNSFDDKSTSYGFRPSVCIDLTLYDSGDSGGSEEPVTNPNWPNKADLTLNNRIYWADCEWVVVEVTGTEAYLALEGLYCGKMDGGWYPGGDGSETTDVPHVTFYNLQQQCDNFLNDTFTAEQQECLKTIQSNELRGKVFAPTYEQVNGQFERYRSDFGRTINQQYWMDHPDLQYESWWTSEEYFNDDGTVTTRSYAVDAEDGSIKTIARSTVHTIRPHICIDLSVYEGGV